MGPVGNVTSDETEEGGMDETDREDEKSGHKNKEKTEHKSVEDHRGCSPKKKCWYQTRKKLWGIVESKYFNRGIMIAILINTISMGIEHHEQVQFFILIIYSNTNNENLSLLFNILKK